MSKPLLLISHSASETEQIGASLAPTLCQEDLLCLYGPIGSGKTTFVRGLAHGLGLNLPVRSPSFILIHEYSLPQNQKIARLFHIDLYRLNSPQQVAQLGLEECLERGLCVIEWADRAEPLLPPDRLNVRFEILENDHRRLLFEPHGHTQMHLQLWIGQR